jgi:haloacid dehalogenase-like hydrolase
VRGSGRGEVLAPDPQEVGARRQALRREELFDDVPLIKMIALSLKIHTRRAAGRGARTRGRPRHADAFQPHPGHSGDGSRRVTKGSSLADLARMWGIAPEDVVTFGDMPNDIEMLWPIHLTGVARHGECSLCCCPHPSFTGPRKPPGAPRAFRRPETATVERPPRWEP